MTKEELWMMLVEKHPQFGDPNAQITMKQPGLRRLFDIVWEKGLIEGVSISAERPTSMNNIFGNIGDWFSDTFKR